jgi:hypothetical protein
MENANCSSDLLFAADIFEDMQEFLELSEEAWTPRSPGTDPDKLYNYRPDWIQRHLFCSTAKADERYNQMVESQKNPMARFGPKVVSFRRTRNGAPPPPQEGKKEGENTEKGDKGGETNGTTERSSKKACDDEEHGFDFAKAFPKTFEQFQNGKFRWFRCKNSSGSSSVFRVLVGRGSGHDHREFCSDQILRT